MSSTWKADWSVDDNCYAPYQETSDDDVLYYPAKIESMDPTAGDCTVTFSEYGNTELIALRELDTVAFHEGSQAGGGGDAPTPPPARRSVPMPDENGDEDYEVPSFSAKPGPDSYDLTAPPAPPTRKAYSSSTSLPGIPRSARPAAHVPMPPMPPQVPSSSRPNSRSPGTELADTPPPRPPSSRPAPAIPEYNAGRDVGGYGGDLYEVVEQADLDAAEEEEGDYEPIDQVRRKMNILNSNPDKPGRPNAAKPKAPPVKPFGGGGAAAAPPRPPDRARAASSSAATKPMDMAGGRLSRGAVRASVKLTDGPTGESAVDAAAADSAETKLGRQRSFTMGDSDLYGNPLDSKNQTSTRRRERSASVAVRNKVIGNVQIRRLNQMMAEAIVMNATNREPGCYIFSDTATADGDLVLTVMGHDREIEHVPINQKPSDDSGSGTLYWLADANKTFFQSLEDLRKFFKTKTGTVDKPKLIPTRLSVEINPQDVDPKLLMDAMGMGMSSPTSPVSPETSGSKKDKKAEKRAARDRMKSFKKVEKQQKSWLRKRKSGKKSKGTPPPETDTDFQDAGAEEISTDIQDGGVDQWKGKNASETDTSTDGVLVNTGGFDVYADGDPDQPGNDDGVNDSSGLAFDGNSDADVPGAQPDSDDGFDVYDDAPIDPPASVVADDDDIYDDVVMATVSPPKPALDEPPAPAPTPGPPQTEVVDLVTTPAPSRTDALAGFDFEDDGFNDSDGGDGHDYVNSGGFEKKEEPRSGGAELPDEDEDATYVNSGAFEKNEGGKSSGAELPDEDKDATYVNSGAFEKNEGGKSGGAELPDEDDDDTYGTMNHSGAMKEAVIPDLHIDPDLGHLSKRASVETYSADTAAERELTLQKQATISAAAADEGSDPYASMSHGQLTGGGSQGGGMYTNTTELGGFDADTDADGSNGMYTNTASLAETKVADIGIDSDLSHLGPAPSPGPGPGFDAADYTNMSSLNVVESPGSDDDHDAADYENSEAFEKKDAPKGLRPDAGDSAPPISGKKPSPRVNRASKTPAAAEVAPLPPARNTVHVAPEPPSRTPRSRSPKPPRSRSPKPLRKASPKPPRQKSPKTKKKTAITTTTAPMGFGGGPKLQLPGQQYASSDAEFERKRKERLQQRRANMFKAQGK